MLIQNLRSYDYIRTLWLEPQVLKNSCSIDHILTKIAFFTKICQRFEIMND